MRPALVRMVLVALPAAAACGDSAEVSVADSVAVDSGWGASESSPDALLPPAPLDASIDGARDAHGLDGTTPPRDSAADGTRETGSACTVQGVEGECLDVSVCSSRGSSSTPGYCPGPPNIQCCTVGSPGVADGGRDATPTTTSCRPNKGAQPTAVAGSGWCPHDPSLQPNLGLLEEPGAPGCPSGMLLVPDYCYVSASTSHNVDIRVPVGGLCPSGSQPGGAFCIDRFEASLVMVGSSGDEEPWSPYYEPPATGGYRAVSLRGAIPQSNINGCEAARACAASGKRLCSNTEWLRACRGSANNTYPYGNTRTNGACNDESLHPKYSPAQCFHSTESWIYSEIEYPGINQQAGTLTRTGSLAACESEDGVFDMMGNVHEWIDDPVNESSPRSGIDFRGGYYNDTKINQNGCLYRTVAHDNYQVDYSVGFRCCADAP